MRSPGRPPPRMGRPTSACSRNAPPIRSRRTPTGSMPPTACIRAMPATRSGTTSCRCSRHCPTHCAEGFGARRRGRAYLSARFPVEEPDMSLRINDVAPDFTAETTQGPIQFHQWIGDQWAILFSHPKDFTPVCTTELGYMARIEPEFTKRNTKLIGLSVDPVAQHSKWAKDIEETQGATVKYPMIGDPELKVAKLYNMLPAEEPGSSEGRTAANNATVRSVFIIGPDKKIKLM